MGGEEHQNIRVVVRVRPNNQHELESKQKTIIKIIDNTTLLFDPEEDEDEFYYQGVKQNYRDITKKVNKKLSMEFDRIFDAESTNEDVFRESTKPLIESVMNGYNCSVFVYGATGAGKTFTMLGNENYPGITFLTMKELFDRIIELSESRKFDIGISYLEIYNEQVMNLLTKSGPLKLREDANGVVVSGLVLMPIKNAEELITLLIRGNKNRTQHPTDANAESSRSHAIFQVHIRMTEKKTGQKRTVKLSMIDLAGSERAASTKGIGVRFKEGANINKSLLALGNCINKLADGLKHIPYRDSNLTRILKDSLGGNCRTLMIANVSPSSLTFEDTYNTLKYASRAKKIRTVVRQNIMKTNMPKDYYVKKVCELVNENEKLKETIKQLEVKLSNTKPVESNNGFDELEFKTWCKRIDTVYSSVIKAQEGYLSVESQEKLLALKMKQINHTIANKKALSSLDEIKISEDIARMKSSIDRLEKQITAQKEQKDNWKKRYDESAIDLKKLLAEIKKIKFSSIMNSYVCGKDKEIENSKLNLQFKHLEKVKNLDYFETENTRKLLLHGFQIFENNYLILRKNNLIDKKQEDMIKKFIKMTNSNGHVVKFNGQQQQQQQDNNKINNDGNNFDNEYEIMSFADEHEICRIKDSNVGILENRPISSILNNNKRKYISNNEDNNGNNGNGILKNKINKVQQQSNNGIFKVPITNAINMNNATATNSNYTECYKDKNENNDDDDYDNEYERNRINLDETHVLSDLNTINEINSTFLVPSVTTTAKTFNDNNRKSRVDMLKSILTESNVNTKNGQLITKALIKSNLTGHNLISRVAAATINKENTKFSPNKIKKNQKSTIKNVTSKALNSAATIFSNRQHHTRSNTASPKSQKFDGTGRVRLNRAASMRTKK